MKSRLLITGAGGFVGSHLLEELQNTKKYQVFGTTYSKKFGLG